MNNEMCGCAAEEKTPSAKGIVRINYKEDFELVVELLADGKPYRLGNEDFRIDFMVMASRYTVGRTAGVCERCMVVGVNKVRCFMDGHGLPPGELRAEVRVDTPDVNYADGKRLSVAIADGVVVLVNDNTRFDGAVVTANIPVVLIDAYQLARERGYKGTMDEYYATFSDVSVLMAGLRDASQAESRRREVDKERDALVEKMRAAWQDIERMCEIRKGEYARELELVERIRNAPKDPTQDVWLDATDGEVKSGPAEGNLTSKALAYYYLGRRMVRGSFTGASREDGWLGCKLVRHLDVRGWDMTLCTDASLKFQGYSNLRFLDTSGWSLAALTNGYYMFANCGSLQTLDTSNWNLSSLKSADSMFSNCGSLQTLDTSGWSLAALTNGYQMFANCGSLQTLDASKWSLAALTNGSYMFLNCANLRRLDMRGSSFHLVAEMARPFGGCNHMEELWLPMTFDKLSSLDLSDIPSWGITEEGLKSLRWTFGDGAEDRTAKGLQPCTVRLHVNVYDRLTDEERAAAAKKGWTITK